MSEAGAARASSDRVARARRIGLPIAFMATAIGLLEWTLRLHPSSDLIAAPPSAIVETIIASFPILMENAAHTATEASIGFVLGATSGCAAGFLMAMFSPLRRALYPNLVAFQLVPKIALAPLFTLWLGVGAPSRVAFTIFLCFFPVTVGAVAGLQATPSYAIDLARSLRATRWQTFLHVRLPFALPFVATALKVSATLAMVGIVVGEFVTAQTGLGYIILFASSAGDARLLFAAFTLLCVEGLILYGVVLLACRLAAKWYGAPFEAADNPSA